MGLQCLHIRNDLADCVMKTDCYLKDGKSAQECITSHMAELPTECQHLYKSFVECRRGMVSHPLSLPFPLPRSCYSEEAFC